VDVLAIILACSLHPDDALVRALVDVQSGGNAYFVGDLATLKTKDTLASPEAALRYAEDLRRHGGRPAVGLLGIPLKWAGRYGRAPIELFDGCINVAVATAAFHEYQASCAAPHARALRGRSASESRRARRHVAPAALRSCLLLRFARDLGLQAAPAAILQRLSPAASAPPHEATDPPPQRSYVFVGGAEDKGAEPDRVSRPPIFLDAPGAASDTR
jgi:hypothetical protein